MMDGFFVHNSEEARNKRNMTNLNKDSFRKLPPSPGTFPAGAHQQSSAEDKGNKCASRNLALNSQRSV